MTAMTPRLPVLVVEDTPSLQTIYRSVLTAAGYAVTLAGTAAEGLASFRASKPRIVLLDLVLPDRDGMTLMREILAEDPQACIIVMTANSSVGRAVEAMRAGAFDFLVKPFEEDRFLSSVRAAAENLTSPESRDAPARRRIDTGPADRSVFIGSSEVMAQIHRTIGSVARSMATVFVTGESGTGKELAALAVHARSARATGPFIALNCGAIPPDLLESEVFGHMKGSFTGAISDKPGAATAADGGTLFLDEICEMALPLQTKLLRFLQTSTVQPVGATAQGGYPHHLRHQPRPHGLRPPRPCSARICITGSTWCRSTCRPCASAAPTWSRSPRPRWPGFPPKRARISSGWRRKPAPTCRRRTGPATCASC
ncbi:MAG: sigma-54 dependent transcriptional regulator [Paracoccaceae bacterium]